MTIDPLAMLRPRRKIMGISAILLPFLENGEIDWRSFVQHVIRTRDAGLMPAVNMDTGFGPFLSDADKAKAIEYTRCEMAGKPFAAGVFVSDQPGSPFQQDAYARQMEHIAQQGGIPVVCQSFGLTSLPDDQLVRAYHDLGSHVSRFIAFELGQMFAPFGKIYSLEVYAELLKVKSCMGAKHSSLSRELEWQRLKLRDQQRPDFHVFTGNDLAIDMVMYGSDYLLGLSTFAPQLFAQRDQYWETGDVRFYELNDKLQYLGAFAFREPVPAYKHSAAQFLKLLGSIESSKTHPNSPMRPESDVEVLKEIATQLSQ
ncbi:MAG: dihydrodipicolinate synthase family protein [Planctomycetia bacterium]|nr:dihydrodipicolinate synthase family protein [Planctomycetia bacterium]